MQILCTVSEKSELRVVNTQHGEMKVVDVTLKSGSDEIQAAAFDDLAVKLNDGSIHAEALYQANLAFSLRKGEKGTFQSARIIQLDLIFDYNPHF